MKLKHVALYTKGWYQRTDDIWADIQACLVGDDYTPFTKQDILDIVIRNVTPLFSNYTVSDFTIELISSINPVECWKNGYYHKEHTWIPKKESEKFAEYDYQQAVLWFYLSRLQRATVYECGGLPKKANEKVLPLSKKETTV